MCFGVASTVSFIHRLFKQWCLMGWLLCCSPVWAVENWEGVVLHVSDGDTLWVLPPRESEARKLRLAGMDAPEICQHWGTQAWQALRARLLGHIVQVKTGRRDIYGRWLAQVRVQGQDVAGWMVAQGHAWSPGYRGLPGPYEALQRQAQWQRRGMFAHPLGMMPPREFRRWHGSC
jgi:micrococcal nuclease